MWIAVAGLVIVVVAVLVDPHAEATLRGWISGPAPTTTDEPCPVCGQVVCRCW